VFIVRETYFLDDLEIHGLNILQLDLIEIIGLSHSFLDNLEIFGLNILHLNLIEVSL
jgi:hypothetical protein